MKKLLLLFFIGSINFSFAQVALTENFESATFPPTNWTTVNTHATNFWKRTTNSISGAGSAYVQWIAAPQDETLISPTFSLASYTTAFLNFTASVGYEYMVDPLPSGNLTASISSNGGTTWTQLWVEEDYGTYVDYANLYIHLNLSAYVGQTNLKIKFVYIANDADTVKIDDISVTACKSVDNIALTALADNTAATGWVSDAASFDFEWGAVGFTQGTGTLSNQTASTFNFTGLTAGSGYSYYVRANCGTTLGAWQGPFTFYTTLSTPATTPYGFGFESGTLSAGGWARDVPATGGFWNQYTGSTLSQEGNNFAGCLASTTAATNAWLFSRALPLVSGEIITINYFYRKYNGAGTTSVNKLKTAIGTVRNAAAMTTAITDHGTLASLTYIANPAGTTFTAPAAGTYYLGFNCYSPAHSTANNGGVFVDAVTITSNILGNNQYDLFSNMYIISPNPVDNYFQVELENKISSSDMSLILTDLNGKVVRQYKKADSYDASNLESGVYFLTITDGDHKEVKKLIKK